MLDLGIYTLCIFAFVAGFIDAMVGGGGLIQLPAFLILQPQLSLVQTLATNKTASFLGTMVAAVRYLKQVKIVWRHLAVAIVAAFIGSFSGALLVSHVRKEDFMPFIVVVLVLVLFYTIKKKNLGVHETNKPRTHRQYFFYALAIGGIIGFYDGLIGPGTGSFLIFAFVVLYGYNFLHASANAKIINCVTNISALIFFFTKGAILWSLAIPVGAANMLGNYAGSQLALKKGSGFVRAFFIVVVASLIAKLGWGLIH
jgi:uncharacterized membrane protein YfcA